MFSHSVFQCFVCDYIDNGLHIRDIIYTNIFALFRNSNKELNDIRFEFNEKDGKLLQASSQNDNFSALCS